MNTRTRLVIYAAVAGALGVLVALGIVTTDQSDSALAVTSAGLDLAAAAALALAARRITPDSWSGLRLALYVLTSAVLTAAGAWGVIAPETSSAILGAADEVLSALGVVLLGVAAQKVPPTDYLPKRGYQHLGLGPTPKDEL